jgi:predicted O-methyltransferase YrrM
MFDKLPRRFKQRIRLVFAAIFSKWSDLDATMVSMSKAYEFLYTTPPDVVLRGWSNLYGVLTGLLPQYGSLDNDILQLADIKKHPQSSEEDVLQLLYNMTRQTKSKTIIEVGIFHGAASLSMAQGIDENGGGEIHLIDISEEFLSDVFVKISQKGWKVTTHKHHININKETEWDKLVTTGVTGLPKADIIFIDAGHSYKEVKNDVHQYQTLVSPGGFLILHDTIQQDGPRRVVSDMFDKGLKFCSLVTSEGCGVTIIRY